MACLLLEYHGVLNFPSQKVNRRTGKGSKAATKLIKACSTEEQLNRLILISLKKMQMRVAVVKFYKIMGGRNTVEMEPLVKQQG